MTVTATPPVMPDQTAVLYGLETSQGVAPDTAVAARLTAFRSSGLPGATTEVPEIGQAQFSQREPFALAADLREPTLGVEALLDLENIQYLLHPFLGAPTVTVGSGLDTGLSQHLYRASGTGGVQTLTLRGLVNGESRTGTGLVGDQLTIPLGRSGGFRTIAATYQAFELLRNLNWTPTTTNQPRAPYLVPGWNAALLVNGVAAAITDGTFTLNGGANRVEDVNNRDVATPRPGRITASIAATIELVGPSQIAPFVRAVTGSPDAVQLVMWPAEGTDRRRMLIDLPFTRLTAPDLEINANADRITTGVTVTSTRDPSRAAGAVAVAIWRTT